MSGMMFWTPFIATLTQPMSTCYCYCPFAPCSADVIFGSSQTTYSWKHVLKLANALIIRCYISLKSLVEMSMRISFTKSRKRHGKMMTFWGPLTVWTSFVNGSIWETRKVLMPSQEGAKVFAGMKLQLHWMPLMLWQPTEREKNALTWFNPTHRQSVSN